MNTWGWSYLIWGVRWLLIGFLLFELLAKDVSGIAPWMSLTATGRHAVSTYGVWVGLPLMALFVFFPCHFLFGRAVWQSVLFGLVVSGSAHLLDKAWP